MQTVIDNLMIEISFLSSRRNTPKVPHNNAVLISDPSGPDVLDPDAYLWPDSTPHLTQLTPAHCLPFHYPNPDGTWLTDEERYAVKTAPVTNSVT